MDIKSMHSDLKNYFTLDSLTQEESFDFLPNSLKVFLLGLSYKRNIQREVKISAIGQALMKLVWPTDLICPLQVGLGVDVHYRTGSEFLVQTLQKLGFTCTIDEVRRFEKMHLYLKSILTKNHHLQ